MPLLTDYWFHHKFWYETFDQINQPFPADGRTWTARDGSSAATLTWVRQDDEHVLDFALIVGNPLVEDAVNEILEGTSATRTSNLTTQGMFWKDVPYNRGDARRHQPWDMLVRVYFDVHIRTPWYCTAADATLAYYLLFWLDESGHLQGRADYATWAFSGGGPFCEGGINDRIRDAMTKGFPKVQDLLDRAIPLLAQGTYSALYFLPGNGTRSGGFSTQDGNRDVALTLLPKES
jgi:hypothetical protein